MSITHAAVAGSKVEVNPDYIADHDLGGESLVTPDQRAALDANSSLNAGNGVASMADVGGGFNYIQVADPGAVGAGKIWLQLPPTVMVDGEPVVIPATSLQLWRRKETDDGWTPIGSGDRFTTPAVEAHTYFWDVDGNPVSDIYRGVDGEIDFYSLGDNGSTFSITAAYGIFLGPSVNISALKVAGVDWTQLIKVVSSPPGSTAFQAMFVFDDTPSTGGLYGWTGSAYAKIGLATS